MPEICDGADQDCDGNIDEDAMGTGVVCNPDGRLRIPTAGHHRMYSWRTLCTGSEPADPCNDIDNDCDGRIGEDVRGQMYRFFGSLLRRLADLRARRTYVPPRSSLNVRPMRWYR